MLRQLRPACADPDYMFLATPGSPEAVCLQRCTHAPDHCLPLCRSRCTPRTPQEIFSAKNDAAVSIVRTSLDMRRSEAARFTNYSFGVVFEDTVPIVCVLKLQRHGGSGVLTEANAHARVGASRRHVSFRVAMSESFLAQGSASNPAACHKPRHSLAHFGCSSDMHCHDEQARMCVKACN